MSRLLPRGAGARAILGIVAFFVVLNVIALVVSTVRPEPSGEDSSAYATQPRGAAAYAELLRRDGHPVRLLRTALGDATLDPGATLVVLDAPALDGAARRALARFVRAGGRLVAGGEDAGAGVVPRAPTWARDGLRTAVTLTPVPETRFVRRVVSAGTGSFIASGGAVVALGDGAGLLAVAPVGRGRALLLADASPLQNRLLARADNAALALALAGPAQRPVTFVESVHGFGRATGLAALPARWRLALVVAVLAAALWLVSRARRFGPAEDPGADPPPARREHVEALAIGLARARDRDALRRGFEEDEAAALTGEDGTDEALALGRALARGRR